MFLTFMIKINVSWVANQLIKMISVRPCDTEDWSNNAFLMRTKKWDHITPALRSLHWLQVRCRVNFKILLLVFKSLHGLAPAYLSDSLTFVSPVIKPEIIKHP